MNTVGGGSQSGASMKPGDDLATDSTLKRILEQDYDLMSNKNKEILVWKSGLPVLSVVPVCVQITSVKILSREKKLAPTDIPEERTTRVVGSALDFIFKKSTSSTQTNWRKQLDHYQMEITIDYNDSPLEWWKARVNKYPTLAELARKYLAIPATSASSERAFSSAGNIVSRKRNCLTPENTTDLRQF
ncbi:E3 SUMO-protein ligase ZBED1-like isoform X2 [Temnothorax longispinosus]|uniref:E3 SUMO-protein ligase ZBED1-like isoform X2 n=1 Tax=Temnothorax longispinosus TaxID=300112 RepID=UPI003A99F7AF